jgi:hypothetical protein
MDISSLSQGQEKHALSSRGQAFTIPRRRLMTDILSLEVDLVLV